MFRKLIALALIGGGVAAAIKKLQQSESAAPSPEPFSTASGPAGGDEPAAAQPAAAEDLADVRPAQTEETVTSPMAGVGDEESVVPDVSADDTNVREEEDAAATEAGSIGGAPDPATADTDPSMRPVHEGSGDDPETFETTEDQGR